MRLGLVLALLTRFWTGSPEDVRPRLHGPVLVLAGGGGDQTVAMQAAVDAIRGCSAPCAVRIDVVVIRASGGDGYNPYLMALDGVDSVVSMVITDRESAMREDVARIVRNAELVFFAGGDQCNYIRWIKGTRVADAVKSVHRRGGAIGGTSAGLAIQGEIAYDACPNQSAKSAEVLMDPFHVDVSLSRGFFAWPEMRGVITDTHFRQRERLGRLLVFMARGGQTGLSVPHRAVGLGISERTVLLLDKRGVGRVYGDGPVDVVIGDRPAEVLERGKPLTWRGLRIKSFAAGESLDLRDLTGGERMDVVDGQLGSAGILPAGPPASSRPTGNAGKMPADRPAGSRRSIRR